MPIKQPARSLCWSNGEIVRHVQGQTRTPYPLILLTKRASGDEEVLAAGLDPQGVLLCQSSGMITLTI